MMAAETKTADRQQQGHSGLKQPPQGGDIATISAPRLPYHPAIEERFGVTKSQWKALIDAIFPTAASTESVILALSYCQARKLDIFKRVVHIVPIWSKQQGRLVDTVWPGIGELRTTAHRTGTYAGKADTVFGPDVRKRIGRVDMVFPEWAQIAVFKIVAGVRCEFVGPKVYWEEAYAEYGGKEKDVSPNAMWESRPRGQLDKCAEAAALRCAFPEEIGSEYCAEEVGHLGRAGMVTLESTASIIPPGQTKSAAAEDLLASRMQAKGPSKTEPAGDIPEVEQPPVIATDGGDREPGDEVGEQSPHTKQSLIDRAKAAKTMADLQQIGRDVEQIPENERSDVFLELDERGKAIKAAK